MFNVKVCSRCGRDFRTAQNHEKSIISTPFLGLAIEETDPTLTRISNNAFTVDLPFDLLCQVILLHKPTVRIKQDDGNEFEFLDDLPIEEQERILHQQYIDDVMCGSVNKSLLQRWNLRHLTKKRLPHDESVESLWKPNAGPYGEHHKRIVEALNNEEPVTGLSAFKTTISEKLTVLDGFLIKKALEFLPDIPSVVKTGNFRTIESLSGNELHLKTVTFTEELISATSGLPMKGGLIGGSLHGGIVICLTMNMQSMSPPPHLSGSSFESCCSGVATPLSNFCECKTYIEFESFIGYNMSDLYEGYTGVSVGDETKKSQHKFGSNPLVQWIVKYSTEEEFKKSMRMISQSIDDIRHYVGHHDDSDQSDCSVSTVSSTSELHAKSSTQKDRSKTFTLRSMFPF
eukprot:GHVH01007364.1.p1 GENE.GHVH01007364.1~~GHVH01007364.1.p1  ORF type:complete len:401 (-),score=37.27 GHVH01007364.1:568-1770(-)